MQWFAEHPEYLKVPFYVGGDGYSGIIVPLVTELILAGNLSSWFLQHFLPFFILK